MYSQGRGGKNSQLISTWRPLFKTSTTLEATQQDWDGHKLKDCACYSNVNTQTIRLVNGFDKRTAEGFVFWSQLLSVIAFRNTYFHTHTEEDVQNVFRDLVKVSSLRKLHPVRKVMFRMCSLLGWMIGQNCECK